MTETYYLRGPYLGVAILVIMLCVDVRICYILLNLDGTREHLPYDIVSIGVKLIFVLLSVYRSHYWRVQTHTRGFIGEEGKQEKSIYLTYSPSIILHSLLCFICVLRIGISLTRWDCSVLTVASCMMGLCVWVLDPSLVHQAHFEDVRSYMEINSGKDGGKSTFDFKEFLRDRISYIIQSSPVLYLNIGGWLILISGLDHLCGKLAQKNDLIEIICILSVCIATSIACLVLRLPLRPFPAYSPRMTGVIALSNAALTIGHIILLAQKRECSVILSIFVMLTHVPAIILVHHATSAREYIVPVRNLKVSGKDQWWTYIFLPCIPLSFGTMLFTNSSLSELDFEQFAEAFTQLLENKHCLTNIAQFGQKSQSMTSNNQFDYAARCGDSFIPCVNALNQLVVDLRDSGKIVLYANSSQQCQPINMPATVMNQVCQIDKPEMHLFRRVWNGSKKLGQIVLVKVAKAFNESAGIGQSLEAISDFLKPFKEFRRNLTCAEALNQYVKALDEARPEACTNVLYKLVKALDQFEQALDQSKIMFWITVVLLSIIVIWHLPYVVLKEPVIGWDVNFRGKCVTFGREYLKNKSLDFVRDLVPALCYPLVFLAAMILYRTAKGLRNCPAIALRILCIALMCISGHTDVVISEPPSDTSDDDKNSSSVEDRDDASLPNADTHAGERPRSYGVNPYSPQIDQPSISTEEFPWIANYLASSSSDDSDVAEP